MRKVFSIVLVLAILSLTAGALASCSSTNSTTMTSSNAATTTSSALQQKTILIGVDTPLTGPAAAFGIGQEHGVELAFQDANSAGGLTVGNTHYTFKVTALDDQYDTATATNNIRQLVFQDGVQYLFTFQTDSVLATAAELTQQKVIDFTVSEDDSVLTQPTNAYTFRAFVPYPMQATQYFQWITKNYPSDKTMVIMTTNDTNGQVTAAATQASCKAAGLTFLDSIFYDPTTTDYTPFLTKLLAENPDMIDVVGAASGSTAVIIKTARAMGFTGLFVLANNAAADMTPITGTANLEGTLDTNLPFQAPYVSTAVLGLPAREVSEWGQSYGDTWDFYSEATIMYEAMKRADSVDPTVVKNILQDPTQQWPYAAISGGVSVFDSPLAQQLYGPDATNQVLNPWVICVVRNGQDDIQTVIEPVLTATTSP